MKKMEIMRYDNKREYEDELWIEQTLENNIHNTQTHAYTRCTHVHIVVNITFFETVSIYFTEKKKEWKKQTKNTKIQTKGHVELKETKLRIGIDENELKRNGSELRRMERRSEIDRRN